MRTEEFVMRGQTPGAAGTTGKENQEILNFSGYKPGYAFKLVEFSLYPSTNLGGGNHEIFATITAGKSSVDPVNPNYNDDSLIATAMLSNGVIYSGSNPRYVDNISVVNDTFLITQNLILTVKEDGDLAVNWQCRFKPVKMAKAQEAVANYKQFMISDS